MGRVWILFACLSAFAASTQGHYHYLCPDITWRLYGTTSTCVKAFEEKLSYSEAEKFCAAKNSHLVVVQNRDENVQVEGLIRGVSSWIGIADKNKDGIFEYPNGKLINFMSWQRGEPNNWNNNEYCANMAPDGNWNDERCDTSKRFVCQTIDITDKPSNEECPDYTWNHFGDGSSCVKLFQAARTFKDAERICAKSNSHLVAIESRHENDQIKAMIGDNVCWIGIVDRNKDRNFEYPNGNVISFNSWSRGEPNNWQNNEYCGSIKSDGSWNDANCLHTNKFVCQTNPASNKVCPDNTWRHFGDGSSCVKLFQTEKDFRKAERICHKCDSQLVAIKSQAENDQIKALIGDRTCWIGIVDRNKDRNFEYPNGHRITFNFWSRGEPNNWLSSEYCGNMKSNGYWNDDNCIHSYSFVCQTR